MFVSDDSEGAKTVIFIYLDHPIQAESGDECTTCCQAVRSHELVGCNWRCTGAICVVDDGVERLIRPLPEDDGGR